MWDCICGREVKGYGKEDKGKQVEEGSDHGDIQEIFHNRIKQKGKYAIAWMCRQTADVARPFLDAGEVTEDI